MDMSVAFAGDELARIGIKPFRRMQMQHPGIKTEEGPFASAASSVVAGRMPKWRLA